MAGESEHKHVSLNAHKDILENLSEYLKRESPDADQELLLSTSSFAQTFFSKAPGEFVERNTLEDHASVTNYCYNAFHEYTSGSDSFVLRSTRTPTKTLLTIVVGDRPFVINSIRECITDYGVNIFTFIHPIYIEDGLRISLSYIELSPLSESELEVLMRRLTLCLQHVVKVTDDYQPMLAQVETVSRTLSTARASGLFTQSERHEVSAFLRWLIDHHLLFLAHLRWPISDGTLHPESPAMKQGLFDLDTSYSATIFTEATEDAEAFLKNDDLISVNILRSTSLVQRRNRLTHILVKEIGGDGSCVAVHSILGLFTSNALTQESSTIPLIRLKLAELLKAEMVVEDSHEHKNIVHILDSMPKEEALSIRIDELRDTIHTILDIQNKNETRVSIRFDSARRGASVLIVMPGDRFNSDVRRKVQEHVEKIFGTAPGASEYYLDLSSKPHARFYFLVPLSMGTLPPVSLAELEKKIVELTRRWKDNLEEEIFLSGRFANPTPLWHTYSESFAEDYQALQSVEECMHDIEIIEKLSASSPLSVGTRPAKDGPAGSFYLILYHLSSDITISKAFPILENTGLEVLKESTFVVKPAGKEKVFLQRFQVKPHNNQFISEHIFNETLAPGLIEIFSGSRRNDILNSLMLSANLNTQQITLLRSYCYLLWQINTFATRSALFKALSEVPTAANQLWNMFDIKFNPDVSSTLESRTQRFEAALKSYKDSLRDVHDITRDRILRALVNILEATVRTNYYIDGAQAIALKIQSGRVEIMPAPRPLYEIYVWEEEMEGIHLRSDMISRGGLRYSDRYQDFRSEVLGLMKTQKFKNALIVPGGAKGGFIIKRSLSDSSDAREAVKHFYKLFIRSLLSITDNRVAGEVKTPDRVIAFDGEDPYFVVAADKGTATFSDIANQVAQEEFKFWLGDAFASGGTNGYDHKKYGITARGAWESVKRHFQNIGIDYSESPFTAVGIGDMSGDVFGNGMLLSDKIKLIAAFNHRHIFIDPDPDPATSYAERQRLFQLERSGWNDYSADVLSKGAGIYDRFQKEIELSPEARSALSLGDDVPHVLDGETLISHVLRAKCDLLWNGGIGTYVKSRTESNADVNDGTNDRVRVNADDLRARVIGEGGNLGLTQKARIEFARLGGHLHTDAIDNSAGVDLSDHEVNLKILFGDLIQKGEMTLEERNSLLVDLSDEVIESVLQNNKKHSLLLTIGEGRSRDSIEYFRTLLHELAKRGYIDRQLDNLPTDDELKDRAERNNGLTKPELAVCLAAVKMLVKAELVSVPLLQDPLLHSYLLDYFPERLREKRAKEISDHPLAQNIVATQFTNMLVNAVGITFTHRMCLNYSTTPVVVMKCILAAHIIIDARTIRSGLMRFDNFEDNDTFYSLNVSLNNVLRDASRWILSNHRSLSLQEIVAHYAEPFQELVNHAEETLCSRELELFRSSKSDLEELQLDGYLLKSFSCFPRIHILLEMIWTARDSAASPKEVAHVYSTVSHLFNIDTILSAEHSDVPANKWERELFLSSLRDINRSISHISSVLLKNQITEKKEIQQELERSTLFDRTVQIIAELSEYTVSIASIAVLSRHLAEYHLTLLHDKEDVR